MSDTAPPLPTIPELEGGTREDIRRQRLFFALWPDEGVREGLAALARDCVGPRGRLVKTDNIHLTLQFLGSVDGDRRDSAELVAKAVRVPPFVLHLDRLGIWRKPKVAWSAPSHAPGELLSLVEALRIGLQARGFDVETRPYQAHVTLARKVTATNTPLSHKHVLWKVGRFYLVESITHASGAQYRLLKSWPLRIV